MAFVRSALNSHWYSLGGIPTYEVPYADKKRKGEFRPTTLTDARKLNLLPSVTNILDIQAKPQLTTWKIEWAMIAVETTPRIESESSEDFLERCARDAEEIASAAAKFGSRVHQSIEDYLVQGEVTTDEEILPYFENWLGWAQDNLDLEGVLFSEMIVVGHGYAGRTDLKARAKIGSPLWQQLKDAGHNPEDFGVIDFKTRRWSKGKTEKDNKPTTYSSDPSQLAAYMSADIAMTDEDRADECASWTCSVLINSERPEEKIHAVVWKPDEIERGMRIFLACLELWSLDRNYDPREVQSSTATA
jgi:hypothetical protein